MKPVTEFPSNKPEDKLEFALPSNVLMSPLAEELLSSTNALPNNYTVAQNFNQQDAENLSAFKDFDVDLNQVILTPACYAPMTKDISELTNNL